MKFKNVICAFTTSDRHGLVMECVNDGELFFFHLSRVKRFSEEHKIFHIAEIFCAIGYFHSRKIIYRDIKVRETDIICEYSQFIQDKQSNNILRLIIYDLVRFGMNRTKNHSL